MQDLLPPQAVDTALAATTPPGHDDRYLLGDDLRRRLADNLGKFQRRELPLAVGERAAAVAVCLLNVDVEPKLLLVKRVSHGLNAGQWAFPGGRLEPGETVVQAALRELAEEAGIVETEESVIGLLDDFPAASGHRITPVVVCARPGARPRRNPAEVHSLHRIALRTLLSDRLPRWREQADGSMLLQMPLRRGMVVHAPTGAILWQFREVALRGNELRVADLLQPAFTHQ